MDFLDSTQVSVFPSTGRTVSPVFGIDQRLMNEQNLIGMVSSVMSKNAYVIDEKTIVDNGNTKNCIRFVIDGYLFYVDKSALGSKKCYAKIQKSEGGALVGDNDTQFKGLIVDDSDENKTDWLYIWNGTKIPEESKIMYAQDRISDIDCGEY